MYLNGEEDDGDEAHPGVEAVEVGDGRGAEVVAVEDHLEADHGQEEGGDHHGRVDQLQLLLALVAEHAVEEDSWE
jgi:hypothetical protein